MLPNLPYTPRQMFWLSTAHYFCIPDQQIILYSSMDIIHAPNNARVRGSFSNIPEFSLDFNCSLGTPMNPTKKCIVW